MKLNIQLFGGRGASSSIAKETDIRKYSVRELWQMVDKEKHTNVLSIGNGIEFIFAPSGMVLRKENKTIATNKKEIEKYLDKNKLKVRL